jgi:hypothetical protein
LLADKDGLGNEKSMDIVFTIASSNYLAQVRVLMDSLAVFDPDVTRVVVQTDGVCSFPTLGEVEKIDAMTLGSSVPSMSLYYDATEFNTAVKPLAMEVLLRRPHVNSVTYLDPDIQIFHSLREVRAQLTEASVALIPHRTAPMVGDGEPSNLTLLRSGGFNLGFIAARPVDDTLRLMDWWAERCRFDARIDFAEGLFTDQRWMDMAPGMVERCAVLRQVDGEPLIFFHYSGFDPNAPAILSRHQTRIDARINPPLQALLNQYSRRLLEAGYASYTHSGYVHGHLQDGRRLAKPLRRAALRAAQAGASFATPAQTSANWFDTPDPAFSRPFLTEISRSAAEVWRGDAACRAVFDLESALSRDAFARWLVETGGQGLDDAGLLAAVQPPQLPTRSAVGPASHDTPWTGPSNLIANWLVNHRPGAPRACEALWRGRADLRQRFSDPASTEFLYWCSRIEALEGRFDVAALPVKVLASLCDREAVSSPIGDPVGRALSVDQRSIWLRYRVAAAANWPRSLRRTLQEPLTSFIRRPLSAPARAVWDSRRDLQSLFPLNSIASYIRFAWWFSRIGRKEYALSTELNGIELAHGRPTEGLLISDSKTPQIALDLALNAGLTRFATEQGYCVDQRGQRTPTPRKVRLLVHTCAPGLVMGDTLALLRRGVIWQTSIGLWIGTDLDASSGNDPLFGFVDQIRVIGHRAEAPLPRPSAPFDGQMSSIQPLTCP